jgi:peptide/nickel transport system permease protein
MLPVTRQADGRKQPLARALVGARWFTRSDGRFQANWLRLAPLAILLLVAVFGQWMVTYPPTQVVGPTSLAPGREFWLGTDSSGLDVYSQLVAAARADVLMSLLVVALATATGIAIGLVVGMNEAAANMRGGAARALGRVVDFIQTVPFVVVGLVAVSFYGANVLTLVCAASLVMVPGQAKLVRTEVLFVRSNAYLDAARMAGFGEFELTIRHVLPNALWPALGNATAMLGISITLIAALGFLGVGLPPPTPEWGSMISRGASDAAVGRWWAAGFPALALAGTMIAFSQAAAVLLPKRRGL